mgnify:CR=1 FL=1|tara:strand:+ start:422 stop:919 length:498 start_codon:yes stop_codon:yes gene_type:complete
MDKNYDLLPFRNALVVDDDSDIRGVIAHALQPFDGTPEMIDQGDETMVNCAKPTANFKVVEAESGKNALKLVKKQEGLRQPIQVAFVDMRMAGWDGLETIQHISEHDSRISFIIVTGELERARDRISEEMGSVPFLILSKPFSTKDLFDQGYQLSKRWCRLHGDS